MGATGLVLSRKPAVARGQPATYRRYRQSRFGIAILGNKSPMGVHTLPSSSSHHLQLNAPDELQRCAVLQCLSLVPVMFRDHLIPAWGISSSGTYSAFPAWLGLR